jgi:hypothetical protein
MEEIIMAQEVAAISEVVVSSLGPDVLRAIASVLGFKIGLAAGGLAGIGVVLSFQGW